MSAMSKYICYPFTWVHLIMHAVKEDALQMMQAGVACQDFGVANMFWLEVTAYVYLFSMWHLV